MEIKIHTKHFEISSDQEALIRAKFEKLANLAHRIADESSEIRVDLEYQESKKNEEAFVCHLTLFVPNDTLRAEATHGSLENVVDEVIEKIKAPIERYKDKTHRISDRH